MDYSEYEAEDFLLDPSFQDYCLGKDEQAVRSWEQWMAANPGKHTIIRQARQLYVLLNGNHGAQEFLADAKAFRARFAQHLDDGRDARDGLDLSRDVSRDDRDNGDDRNHRGSREPARFPQEPARSPRKWYYRGAVAATSFAILFLVVLFLRRTPTP